ncbi:hypothetical protein D3C73_841810 [compost metagenome]
MHDRISDKDTVENVFTRNIALGAYLVDQAVQSLAHGIGHRSASVRVHHHIGDAAHQVFAEADLRVGRAGGCHRAAGEKRRKMHGDRRRADITGDPVSLVLQPRIKGDQARAFVLAILVDRRRHLPLAFAQDLLDLRDDMEIHFDIVEMPFGRERHFQPVEITERLFHVGFLDLDITHAHCRIPFEHPLVGRLAHHLRVDDSILRHIDDEVAEDLCRTGKPAPSGQPAYSVVSILLRPDWRDVVD